MYIRRTSGMLTVPSAFRLFSRNAISIRGGATTVLFRVCARYFFPSSPLTRIFRRLACASPSWSSSYLEVFLLTRRPCLNIDRFYFQVSQVTGAALQSTNRDIHGTEQVYGVLPQFVIPHHAVFRFADNNHLLFFELMDTINTTLLDAVCSFFFTEHGE